MSTVIRYERFWMRRDTEANWISVNPTLAAGEFGIVTDGAGMAMKMGDGSTAWNSLPYLHPQMATASGADTITATFDPKPVLVDGLVVYVKAAAANTTAVTFNPNSLGALSVNKHGGTALAAGEIAAAGHVLILVYRSSGTTWELLNPVAVPGAIGDQSGVTYLEGSAPATPASGKVITYAKADGLMYSKDDAGTETLMSGGAGGGFTMVKKSTDQTRNTTTTLADDSALTFALAAGTTYIIRANIHMHTANATMDAKFRLNYTGTYSRSTSRIAYGSPGASGGVDAESVLASSGLVNSDISKTDTSFGVMVISLDLTFVTTTSGTFSFQWAQNTSNGSDITVYAGSYFEFMAA